jgi:phosphoribosyl-dephospho-CoA transferase
MAQGTPSRNQLIWVCDTGWRELRSRQWDADAAAALARWHEKRYPLVVCRAREGTPPGCISAGLAAPRAWNKRRIALDVHPSHVQMVGAFPTLLHVARSLRWRSDSQGLLLLQALDKCGAETRVYGSFGWQFLTTERYVSEASDIDLSIAVRDFDMALRTLDPLENARLPHRLDGELVFPSGHAVAWREFARAVRENVAQVLVKCSSQARLVDLVEICGNSTSDNWTSDTTACAA